MNNVNNSIPLSFILVHAGSDFFPYIVDCVNQIKKFNSGKVYLVISKIHNDEFRGVDVELINTEDISKTDKHLFYINNSKLNRSFRNGFWFYATERLFYVEDVMIEHDIQNVIHMENDTLIYFNVEEYREILETHYKMAATFDNDERCIPCFLYIKSVDYFSELTKYIIGETDEKNDMEFIACFKKKNNTIDNLPVVPEDYVLEFKSPSGRITCDKKQYSKNIDLFDSIFDGAALGQYIGGIDLRNGGRGIGGFINESSLFNVSTFGIFWKVIEGNKIPFIKYKDREYRINNLHIHSKLLTDFM